MRHETRRTLGVVVALALLSAAPPAGATAEVPEARGVGLQEEFEPSWQQQLTRYSVLIGAPTAVLIFGLETWDWGEHSEWRWGDEGWFGQGTHLGGADKLGHAFACYVLFRGSYAAFDWTENGGWTKWLYASLVSGLIGTGIEVGDAFTGRYGFSPEDLVADVSGIALGALLEASPVADAFLGFSVTYWPTRAFIDYEDKSFLDIEGDSSGWTYYLNLKVAGLAALDVDPGFFRYLMVDVGYYTRGFTKYDQSLGPTVPKRFWFLGASVNLPEVARSFFDEPESLASRALQTPFEYYHVPAGFKVPMAVY